jgi:hypothetical protein
VMNPPLNPRLGSTFNTSWDYTYHVGFGIRSLWKIPRQSMAPRWVTQFEIGLVWPNIFQITIFPPGHYALQKNNIPKRMHIKTTAHFREKITHMIYWFWCRMPLQLPLVVLPTLQCGPDIDWWLVSVVALWRSFGKIKSTIGWFQICLPGWTFGWQSGNQWCVKLKQFSHANWISWLNVLSYPIFHEASDMNEYTPFPESQPRQFECVGTQASPAQRISHHSNRPPMVLPGNSRPGRVHDGHHAGLEPSHLQNLKWGWHEHSIHQKNIIISLKSFSLYIETLGVLIHPV